MSERGRFIKVRLSEGEYRDLRRRADLAGVTMSEHVRGTVAVVHDAVDVVGALEDLHRELGRLAGKGDDAKSPVAEFQQEALLLLRELAAARDAQILTRVRAKLAARASHYASADGSV
jgi:hypothetical protein